MNKNNLQHGFQETVKLAARKWGRLCYFLSFSSLATKLVCHLKEYYPLDSLSMLMQNYH